MVECPLVDSALGFYCLVLPLLGGDPRHAPELTRRPPAANSQPQGQRNWIPNTVKVNTRLVVLEVVATDKKGKPITDFKAGDFAPLGDGKDKKVTAFQLEPPTANANVPSHVPAAVLTNAEAAQAASPQTAFVQ